VILRVANVHLGYTKGRSREIIGVDWGYFGVGLRVGRGHGGVEYDLDTYSG
jgi:hypothetical protein